MHTFYKWRNGDLERSEVTLPQLHSYQTGGMKSNPKQYATTEHVPTTRPREEKIRSCQVQRLSPHVPHWREIQRK